MSDNQQWIMSRNLKSQKFLALNLKWPSIEQGQSPRQRESHNFHDIHIDIE